MPRYLTTEEIEQWRKGPFVQVNLYQKKMDELGFTTEEQMEAWLAEKRAEYFRDHPLPDKPSVVGGGSGAG